MKKWETKWESYFYVQLNEKAGFVWSNSVGKKNWK